MSLNEGTRTLALGLRTKLDDEFICAEAMLDSYTASQGDAGLGRHFVDSLVQQQVRAVGRAVLGLPIN
ncbi:hypothetical protein [Stenotrophomonas maltophilia]|uniref:hypothetical protein n=1 Tax=Stenotrophomonas maltophilia TaxID=40324 RepID=UPI0020918605|nr:hypothetical protein [Stenotrophomonas maltophilia]MCO5735937.1 hypothetical protein [Stenotrophomonas maltophilia]